MQTNLALLQLVPLSVFQSRRSIWTTSPACFHPGPPLPPLHPSYASFSLSHLSHHPAVTMLRRQISLIKQELSVVRKKQIWLLSTYHIDLHHSIRRLKQIQSNEQAQKTWQKSVHRVEMFDIFHVLCSVSYRVEFDHGLDLLHSWFWLSVDHNLLCRGETIVLSVGERNIKRICNG